MNKLISYPWVFIALFMVFSCNNKKQEQVHHEGHAHEHPENSKEFHAQLHDEMNQAEIGNTDILSAYYALKDAFVKTDEKQVKSMAQHLISVIKAEGKSALISATEAVSSSENMEGQRKAFEKLSEAVYDMAKESGFGETTIYKQYCPMAFGNKGAFWLSDSEEIMNPYFGDKMLRCGKVTETIKSN